MRRYASFLRGIFTIPQVKARLYDKRGNGRGIPEMTSAPHRSRFCTILQTVGLAATLGLLLCPPGAKAEDGPAPQAVRSGDILRGHFSTQRELKGIEKPLKSEGEFTLAPPYGLIWNIHKPLATTTVFTPAGLAQTSRIISTGRSTPTPVSPTASNAATADGSAVTTSSAQKVPTLGEYYAMLRALLASDIPGLGKKFKVEQAGRAQHWRITLVPKRWRDPLMPFREIRAKGSRFVDEIVIVKMDGSSDTLQFDNTAFSHAPLSAEEKHRFDLLTP